MTSLASITHKIARSQGDPQLIRSGPSSLSSSDKLARGLGWFSIGLGVAEIVAPERFTRALGMSGKESLVRAYGVREIASGILSLSVDKQAGLWSRVAGDGVDIATLMSGLREDNPKRDNVAIAMTMVLGVTLLDVVGAQSTSSGQARNRGQRRLYYDRSGFPKGLAAARGAAKDSAGTKESRSRPTLAAAS
jgi:hypothetical protein